MTGHFDDACASCRPSDGGSDKKSTRQKIRSWQHDYNHHRPHASFGNIPASRVHDKKGLEMRPA
jgi:putative transposase